MELNMSLNSLHQHVIYYLVMEGWRVVGEGVGCRKCGSAPGTGNGAEYVPQLNTLTGNIPFSHGRMEGSGWEGVGWNEEWICPWTGYGAVHVSELTTTGTISFSYERIEGSGVREWWVEKWVCPWIRLNRLWSYTCF